MELRLEPGLAAKVAQWSARTGRPVAELVEDALASYLAEVTELSAMLERRCNEIEEIDSYIGQFSPPAADRLLDELFEAFDMIARFPRHGHRRPDLAIGA